MRNPIQSLAFRISILSFFCLIALAAFQLSKPYFASSAVAQQNQPFKLASGQVSRTDGIAVRAAKRGMPWINFQDGRNLKAEYQAARLEGAGLELALQQSEAKSLSLASEDLNGDSFPDLVAGYANASGGIVAVHLGNPEAFAPQNPETIRAIASRQFPDPFLSETVVLGVPEAPDFLALGDFNRDGQPDILTAAKGSDALYLLAGNGSQSFNEAERVGLPGRVTALTTAQPSEQDGGLSVAVGIDGPDGPAVLVYREKRSLSDQRPFTHLLPAAATAIAAGRLDEDRATDLAVIAGGRLYILHGLAQKPTANGIQPDRQAGQLEAVYLPFGVTTVAVSDFIWDRDARMELAVAADSGVIHILARAALDTGALALGEIQARRQLVNQVRRGQRPLSALVAAKPRLLMNWVVAETTSITIPNAGDRTQPMLMSTLASGQQAHDLLIMNPAAKQLQIAFKEDTRPGQKGTSATAAWTSVTFDTGDEPVAMLPMRLNVHGRPGLALMLQGRIQPAIIMAATAATFTVNNASDTDDAAPGDGNCADSIGNCTLRAAVQEANALAGADTITFADSLNGVPIQLTQVGDDNDANNGDLDINSDLTILGNGQANTILQGASNASFAGNMGDKIFGLNQDGLLSTFSVAISGLTIRFTKNANAVGAFTETGGALDIFLTGTGALPGPTVTITNCTFDSNADQNSYGGAINIDSGDLLGGTNIFRGAVQFTGCTISNNKTLDAGASVPGGGVNLFADKHDVAFSNCSITGNQTSANAGSNGGGINIRHSFGGTISLNTTMVLNNLSGSDGGGIMIAGVGGETVNLTGGSLSGNTAQGTGGDANGGGLFNGNPTGSTSLSGVTISNNTAAAGANARGGGIEDGANAPLTLNNCTISGNSSDNGGGVATTNTGGTQLTTITNCTLSGNTATTGGALFVSNGMLLANLNRIVGNTAATGSGVAQTGGTASVENNWWSCDGFPNAAGCQTGSGTFDADPRVDLRLTVVPGTIPTGGSSTLTASVNQNSNGAAINPTVLNGLTITFAGTLGTVTPPTAPLASLTASSTFTATSCGTSTVSATLDNGTQTATLIINQAPTISACPANITTNTALNQCAAVVTYPAPTATGCPSPTVTCVPASGSSFPKGTTTVTCTANNGVSPDSTCSFTVTVNDNQTPVLSACPANITTTENPPGSGGKVVTYTPPTATDNCPATVNCVPPSGSTFPIGTTPVTCTASDGTNFVSCSFNVTVNPACTIVCPANIVVSNSPGQCGANVPFAPTVTGSCGTVTCSPPSGSFFAVGTTPVSCTTGVGPSCGFTVTVNDTEAPHITTCSTNKTLSTNGGSQIALPNFTGEIVASDNCSPVTITQSPAPGTLIGLGNTTVTFTVKDAVNNSATCSIVVTVVKFNLGSFVAFSVEHTQLMANAKVFTGNVGANTSLPDPNGPPDDKEEVEIGERVTMLQAGSNVVGDTVRLRSDSQVYNVYFNEQFFSPNATILGNQVTPQTLPVLGSLPALPTITPGTQDIVVAANQTLTLAAGSYRNITVNHDATLILTGGVYHIAILDIRQDAKLHFTAPTEMRVKDEMDSDSGAYIGPAPSAPSLLASQIIFYVEGVDDGSGPTPEAVDIGERNTLFANFYAPNGTVRLRSNTTATGAFIGDQVIIGERVELTLKSAF